MEIETHRKIVLGFDLLSDMPKFCQMKPLFATTDHYSYLFEYYRLI